MSQITLENSGFSSYFLLQFDSTELASQSFITQCALGYGCARGLQASEDRKIKQNKTPPKHYQERKQGQFLKDRKG